MCTIFGLEPEEKVWLVANQAKCGLTDQLTDKNRDEDGIEVATSAYRVCFKRLYIDKICFDKIMSHFNPSLQDLITIL